MPTSSEPARWAALPLAALVALALPGSARETITPEDIATGARSAVVVIRSGGRGDGPGGSGTGFVVRKDGVIASNYHVIGDHRKCSVEFADGRRFEPTHVLATDRRRDLALLKIEADDLPTLPLGNSDHARAGAGIVTLGNPLGLEFSVGQGVIAARRELDGQDMLQVAVPLEPGSSGSPVFDTQGRVLGVLGIKSGDAIGFAVPINALKPLLARPRPVPMDTWRTIGALDPAEWTPRFGGTWRQRAGRIHATDAGNGIGGRTLLISSRPPPGPAFEIEVEVRLADEAGAAGLVFCADGQDRHYGFYPTGGRLRLARFDGPTPFTWNILETVDSEHYRPGDWNRLRVRFQPGRITCQVNGETVMESEDAGFENGRVGLVKFREPDASYRRYRVADRLPGPPDPAAIEAGMRALADQIDRGTDPDPGVLNDLADLGPAGRDALHDRARDLEARADELRNLADRVHRRQVVSDLATLLEAEEIDLVAAALHLARLDNPELEVAPYLARVQRMAREVEKGASDAETLANLRTHLFETLRFHGSNGDYYHRSNSYLNEVLDDREGLPITLSLLFVDVARRLGLKAEGVAIPRHFIARVHLEKGERLVDPFNGGEIVTRKQAEDLAGLVLADADFMAADARAILVRMLANLLAVSQAEEETPRLLGYLDAMLTIDPGLADRRGMRAMLLASQRRFDEALADLDHILEQAPDGLDLATVAELRRRIARER